MAMGSPNLQNLPPNIHRGHHGAHTHNDPRCPGSNGTVPAPTAPAQTHGTHDDTPHGARPPQRTTALAPGRTPWPASPRHALGSPSTTQPLRDTQQRTPTDDTNPSPTARQTPVSGVAVSPLPSNPRPPPPPRVPHPPPPLPYRPPPPPREVQPPQHNTRARKKSCPRRNSTWSTPRNAFSSVTSSTPAACQSRYPRAAAPKS